MGKNLNQNDLARRRTSRPLLAVSLAASLAAFGCTTNQNLGNGTPNRSGSELRSAPTSGVTSGQERVMPPPMTSSYTGADAMPRASKRTASRADQAAAILAAHQAARGRYLGTANPGPTARPYETGVARTGGFVNPALLTNPQLTINSSISSGPVAGINTGVGSTFVTNGATVTTPAAAATGFTSSAIVTGVAPTPTTAAAPLPVGALATNRVTPTESVIANSTVTAASTGVVPTTTTLAVTPTTAAATSASATSASVVTSGSAVRLVRPTTGTATITNVGTTSGSTRNQ